MLTCSGIANKLGLKPNYVRDRLVKRVGFPKPDIELSQKTRFWDEGKIELWMRSESKRLNR
jgi:predicted DNA-binding transcriptional regulator AlpA